ncbi:hypothetical protein FKM82_014294 [Ascaphus truei]
MLHMYVLYTSKPWKHYYLFSPVHAFHLYSHFKVQYTAAQKDSCSEESLHQRASCIVLLTQGQELPNKWPMGQIDLSSILTSMPLTLSRLIKNSRKNK